MMDYFFAWNQCTYKKRRYSQTKENNHKHHGTMTPMANDGEYEILSPRDRWWQKTHVPFPRLIHRLMGEIGSVKREKDETSK